MPQAAKRTRSKDKPKAKSIAAPKSGTTFLKLAKYSDILDILKTAHAETLLHAGVAATHQNVSQLFGFRLTLCCGSDSAAVGLRTTNTR
jgi:hypothetical protein